MPKKQENPEISTRRPLNRPEYSEIMIKPREIIPIMAQTADPLGSYTGVADGKPYEKPVQDADDL